MKLNKDKRQLFYQLFKPFVIFVLAVALLSCVFMYSYTLHNSYEELDSQLDSAIRSTANVIDTHFEEMDRIVYRMGLETDIRPYSVFRNLSVHRYAYNVISSYVCGNAYLDDILVYYGDSVAVTYGESATFISSFGIKDVRSFWNYLYRFTDFSYEEFTALLGQSREHVIVPKVHNKNVSTLAQEHAMYIVRENADRAVVFLIDTDEIGKHVENHISYLQGKLSVWDSAGNCVLNFGSDAPMPLENIAEIEKGIVSSQKNGGVLRTVFSDKHSQFIYCIDWPNNPYWHSMKTALTLQLLFFLAAIIAGVLMAFSVSSRIFRPIERTYDFVTSHVNPLSISFDGMINSLQEIESKWEQMKYQMNRQGILCRLQIIGSILYGDKKDEKQILELLQSNSIDLCGTSYDVCVVELEQSAGTDSEISNEFCRYLEECALNEGEKRFAIPLNEHNMFACICVFDDATGRQAPIARFFAALKEGLSDDIIITMGVGNTTNCISGISSAFNKAWNALQHTFLLGRNRMICIDEIRAEDGNELVWYPVKIEEGLIRGLTMGDVGLVQDGLRELETMLRNSHTFVNVSRSILLSVIKRLADTLNAEDIAQAREDLMHVAVMLSNTNITLAEVIGEMNRVLEKACGEIQPKTLKKEGLSERVNLYLRKNMGNDQLSLAQIAEAFGLSSGHFSRLYKQETDMTVMQKLDEIRLEAAEKLIRETYISLDEIISRCGYNDKGNFIRKFKREYTIPPMKYRETHQNQEK